MLQEDQVHKVNSLLASFPGACSKALMTVLQCVTACSPYCWVKARRADDSMDGRTSLWTIVLPVMKSRFFAACKAQLCSDGMLHSTPPDAGMGTDADSFSTTIYALSVLV